MIPLTLFSSYLDRSEGATLPLPQTLATVYGELKFPFITGRPYVISNFVSTLDGVVTLNLPGKAGGGDISGFNEHDRLLMGILRAAADAVIVGTSQLREPPGMIWIPRQIFPDLENEYSQFRQALGKAGQPLQVVVTASGRLDTDLPIFQSGEAPVLILTNAAGARELQNSSLPEKVRISVLEETGHLTAGTILAAVSREIPGEQHLFLVEGGPHLVRYFFEERCLDELFLTVAPQVAGRDPTLERPGFVAGKMLAPDYPTWGTLLGIKQAGDHLFLRYRFQTVEPKSS